MRNIPWRITTILAFTLATGVASLPDAAAAQDKPTLGADDYDQWETLGQATLSPDGLWLAVVVRRVDESSELRVHRTDDSDSVVVVSEGSRPEFGADGGWLAFAIGVSPDERDNLRESGEPVRNGVGLLDLRTGEREDIDAVQSFSFSDDGRYLALRRYGSPDSENAGVDALVRDLDGGEAMSFGNVSGLAWQEEGNLLAMTLDAADRVGNGVRLYEPETGRIRSLDADEATYRELTWREDAPDLAVLKTFEDEAHEDTAHVVLAWRGLDSDSPAAFALDPREPSELPAGTRIVEHRAPVWSEDGATVFLGLQDRIPSETGEADAPEDPADGDGEAKDDGEDGQEDEKEDEEEDAEVEIWHSLDLDPVPRQRVREDQLRRENDIGAWNLAAARIFAPGRRSRGPGRDRRGGAARAGPRRDALRRGRHVPPAVPRPLRGRRAEREPGTRPRTGDARHGGQPRRALRGLVRGRGLLDPRPGNRRNAQRDRRARRDLRGPRPDAHPRTDAGFRDRRLAGGRRGDARERPLRCVGGEPRWLRRPAPHGGGRGIHPAPRRSA